MNHPPSTLPNLAGYDQNQLTAVQINNIVQHTVPQLTPFRLSTGFISGPTLGTIGSTDELDLLKPFKLSSAAHNKMAGALFPTLLNICNNGADQLAPRYMPYPSGPRQHVLCIGGSHIRNAKVGDVVAMVDKSRHEMLDELLSTLQAIESLNFNSASSLVQIKMPCRDPRCFSYNAETNTTTWKSLDWAFQHTTFSSTRFKHLVKVIQISVELLKESIVGTKRDIFYREVEFFKAQSNVDKTVEDLAFAFGVSRHCLNIVAASKGLVTGDLQLTMKSNETIDCRGQTILIPPVEDIIGTQTTARVVLVVEKEATFCGLFARGFERGMLGPCILVTGKGYPDVSTRKLVQMLSRIVVNGKPLPIVCLVDGDPHGIEILLCYKFGSKSMGFNASSLATPTMTWVGLKPSERLVDRDCMLSLTKADGKKAFKMLTREDVPQDIKRELSRILKQNCKAEIQALSLDLLCETLLPRLLPS